MVAVLSRRIEPGVDALLGFDPQGRLAGILQFEPGTSLPSVVEIVAEVSLPGEQLMWVSNRTGEPTADRWDDELVWEEMVGITQANDLVLLDWFVTWGTTAFSLAEFAPTPAPWAH